VLFLDADGQPAAPKDRCCRRTAKLGKGRCVNGAIECGNRGWTHHAAGRVIRIPQCDDSRAIPAVQPQRGTQPPQTGKTWPTKQSAAALHR
jgi:phenylpropionate dioxygenase-like ring-hydroxylating dioxygenase large terminal subunit